MDPDLLLEQSMHGQQSSPEYDEKRQKICEKIALESSSFHSSGQLWDDGVILPQDTRKVRTNIGHT